jgi:hypothetical protein
MKTTLDKTTREELISRISSLNDNSVAQWGEMNIYQMLKHCCLCEELYLGKRNYKRVFLGRLFGKKALKNLLKEETTFPRNVKTSTHFVATGDGNVTEEKNKLIELINEYANYQHPYIAHWFFGKMTKEQIGLFSYKHMDHHLRQFSA